MRTRCPAQMPTHSKMPCVFENLVHLCLVLQLELENGSKERCIQFHCPGWLDTVLQLGRLHRTTPLVVRRVCMHLLSFHKWLVALRLAPIAVDMQSQDSSPLFSCHYLVMM